jgi:hypothetical protein
MKARMRERDDEDLARERLERATTGVSPLRECIHELVEQLEARRGCATRSAASPNDSFLRERWQRTAREIAGHRIRHYVTEPNVALDDKAGLALRRSVKDMRAALGVSLQNRLWAMLGSNQRPPPCRDGALPAELIARERINVPTRTQGRGPG